MSPSAHTYTRILASAKKLMHARSYADVGVATICEHAQVKKGSFYHFFPSKQDLTLAVLERYYVDMQSAIIDKAFVADRPPMQQLEKFLSLVLELQTMIHTQTGRVLGCPIGNLASELSTQDERIRRKIDDLFGRIQGTLKQALDSAVQQGAIEAIDTDATAQAMLAYFEGNLLMAKAHNDPVLLQKLLPAVTNIRIR